jgi:hypothetical protein
MSGISEITIVLILDDYNLLSVVEADSGLLSFSGRMIRSPRFSRTTSSVSLSSCRWTAVTVGAAEIHLSAGAELSGTLLCIIQRRTGIDGTRFLLLYSGLAIQKFSLKRCSSEDFCCFITNYRCQSLEFSKFCFSELDNLYVFPSESSPFPVEGSRDIPLSYINNA